MRSLSKTICSVVFLFIQTIEMPILIRLSKSYASPMYWLRVTACFLWACHVEFMGKWLHHIKGNYVKEKWQIYTITSLINSPSIQSNFKTETYDVTQSHLEYPAKKLEKGFTYFGNVLSFSLTTKSYGIAYALKRVQMIINMIQETLP